MLDRFWNALLKQGNICDQSRSHGELVFPKISRFQPSPWKLIVWLNVVAITMCIISLTGPPNLMETNENRIGAYISDVIQNGNWLCQRAVDGEITSKPPMLTWLSSLAALATGGINRFSLYFPSALATFLLSWTIFVAGQKYFDWRTGFLGGLVYLLSACAYKQFATTRFDGLFALPVALAALAAHRSWNMGGRWIWFWLAAAIATLTKGPLGLLLGGAGLLASIWERRTNAPAPIRGSHWSGIILFLLITGGWFGLAFWQEGSALVDKMLVKELFSHAVGGKQESMSFSKFLQPSINLVKVFAPWSLFSMVALWKIWKNPANNPEERRFERFLFCWFCAGLIIFSVSPHQRGRLIVPLVPVAALLAGREISRQVASWPPRKFFRSMLFVTALALTGFATVRYFVKPHSSHVRETQELQSLAQRFNALNENPFPLTHADSDFVFQIYLKTFRPSITLDEAAQLLQGKAAVFISVRDPEKLRARLGTNGPVLYELARCKSFDEPLLSIVSNRTHLESPGPVVLMIGNIQIEMDRARLVREREREFVFLARPGGTVKLLNTDDSPQFVRIQVLNGDLKNDDARLLSYGETWEINPPK